MRDKDSGKKIFWIYPTNKFVWAGVVICSIFCAFMIYFLCVANLSENKVLFIFLLPISLSILLICWYLFHYYWFIKRKKYYGRNLLGTTQ